LNPERFMVSTLKVSRRRTVLTGLAAAASAGVWPLSSLAQDFPNRSLRIVVPFAAGGVGDLTARAVAQQMATQMGQAVVIDNRPGAGGVAAAEAVVRAEPDGHTLFLMSNGTAVSAGLFRSLPFDTVKDFTPISTLGTFDMAVLVPSESPFKTLGELVAHARANPGKLNVGSINVGSTQNLAAELFKSSAAVQVQIVPFNGTPALVAALRGLQVDAAVEILGPALPQIRAGALRALAVTGQRRATSLPEVPTAAEQGLSGFVASSWNALAAPSRTPPAIVDRLNREVNAALAHAEVRRKLAELNVDAEGSSPVQAASLLASDIRRWSEVIERAGIERR